VEILIDDDIPLDKWQEMLENNHYATPFQSPAFFNLYRSDPNNSAKAIAISDSGVLKALAVLTLQDEGGIKGFFSKRGIIYGGPLVNSYEHNELELLIKEITTAGQRRSIYLEIRNYSDYSQYKDIFIKEGWNYVPYYDIQINLQYETKESLQKIFNYNRRREIRQSLERGATYFICSNDEQMKKVYNILKQNYKERVKLPLPDLDFFLRYFHTQELIVFGVLHNSEIIGGAFCPVLKNRKLFTFYYCGLRLYHKKIFPTHLAILAAMEYCIENSIPVFDFMGAGRPDVEYGVRKYKLEFGGDLLEYGRFIKINNRFLFYVGKLGIKASSIFKP